LTNRAASIVLLLEFADVPLILRTTVWYCCRQGIHCSSSHGTEADLKTKIQDNNKKPNSNLSAGTAADSELQPKIEGSLGHCCPFAP
jgi:hypothetical protein